MSFPRRWRTCGQYRARDKAPRLVVPVAREHEVLPLVVEREQGVLVRREPEEPVLLLDVLDGNVMDRTAPVDELRLALELLTGDAVRAGVHVLVDVAAFVDPLQKLLDEPLVTVVGRADE